MSDDVLITPASRKIEFKDSSGNVDGKIELDSAGNLVLTSPGGGIEIGDSSSDIFVGNGTANIDIIFEQNGEIRGTTGRTVTLGQNDSNITVDALNFNTSTSTLFKSQNGITSSRLSTTTNGTGASTENSTFTAPHTLVGVNNGSTQYALLATLPATGNGTADHVTIEGELGSWLDSTSFRVKFNRRDSFDYDYTLFDHNPVFNASGIVAYQASNGTVTVHAKLTASQYSKLTYTITSAFQATVVDKPSLTTSTPAGTLIFDTNDTSTYPPTMRFPDNQKLEFGAAADLRIYHDGSNSIIEDNGTGSLQLKGAVNINGAYTLPAADGNNAQVLATNGSGTISFQSVGSLAGSGIQNVSDDTSPQLGGNLSTATNEIHISQTSGVGIRTTGNLSSADLTLLRASGSTNGEFGFDIRYMGSRSGNNNAFALEMHNQTGTNVEAITVLQDGKVGINKTTPTAPLHVGGTSTFDDVATFSEGATVTGGSSGDVLLTFATDRSWQFQQSGDDASTRLQLKSNVGSKFFDIVTSSGDAFASFYAHDTTPSLTLTSTNADATSGPELNLYRNSASPAVNDLLGNITFQGEDSGGSAVNYGRITGIITDPTNGSEDGLIRFESLANGSLYTAYQIGYSGNFFYQDLHLMANTDIYFEGSTNDNYETHLTVTDPTADRTITLPDATGTVLLGDSSKFATTSEGIQVTDTGAGSLAVLELGTTSTTEQGMIRLNGSTANKYSTMYTSNGNLHIDSAGTSSYKIFLNWYTSDGNSTTGGTIFGNGNGGQAAKIDGSGNLTLGGSITFSDGSVQTAAGSTEGFSIAMATALG